MPPRRVIVTRPAQEAARWVEALRNAGLDAVALPLIAIAPMADTGALRNAHAHLHRCTALMFVSAAAVAHFFAAVPDPRVRVRCWATGPGTTHALRAAGVAAEWIDAPADDAGQFDSEALWARVHAQVHQGGRVLFVRGADAAGKAAGRDWLARQVESAGGEVETVAAYRRLVPHLDADARQLALDGARGAATWLFSSSEAIGNLRELLPNTGWPAARAVVTHTRIAQTAREAGFGHVHTSSPTLPALVASIELAG
ncbi:MAG: uroporphyrinogen-III synthase [Polaromonas sp.]|nr:uroporphyrinogen-III synthase [Polaromonas sp.]